ncbi:hypothetical protein NHX12_029919 [Muraenolepis orangiensis]|uniref:Uncharacterized protein n=1 Tax=Muraenolepis orangiensis TaxID=630683 RepID=A0A9Q0E7N4_9TELE|nr:hypothetical protein NHX12_029919 [Muraenolepis orangiensis]
MSRLAGPPGCVERSSTQEVKDLVSWGLKANVVSQHESPSDIAYSRAELGLALITFSKLIWYRIKVRGQKSQTSNTNKGISFSQHPDGAAQEC